MSVEEYQQSKAAILKQGLGDAERAFELFSLWIQYIKNYQPETGDGLFGKHIELR